MADGSQFAFTPEVELATRPAWEKVKRHITPMEWRAQAPLIAEINRLKREKDAVILAHNYMTPEIFHGVGDYVGEGQPARRFIEMGLTGVGGGGWPAGGAVSPQ